MLIYLLSHSVTGGGTLWHDLSRRITVTENKAADIMRQLLEITDQLHRSGVVHVGLQVSELSQMIFAFCCIL